nr:MAG TPA: hypothetical protein [Caudoviricetes sp.]DAI77902.1 MAG TPA: hypothetical protein [Caudoviricetes sp.]
MESTVRLRLALFSQVRDVSWNIREFSETAIC